MIETWRWFGPHDPISLSQVKQAGATGIVTALHHIYRGQAWPAEEVLRRKSEIENSGLAWSVVESIPVHNSIKLRSGNFRHYIGAWKDSLVAIAQAGVKVVCYNFMPVVDWTRTDLKWPLPSTGFALRFDSVDFAAYDLFILQRKNAQAEYDSAQTAAARARFEAMSGARQIDLERTIIAGLPGAEAEYNRESLRQQLAEYDGAAPSGLRANLVEFLQEIVPVAEEHGIRIGIHPDDPPWPLFGLPRVVSTAEDVRHIFGAVNSRTNGLTFCVGSFGARADNDLLAMVREFAPRIHFAHLRQVKRESDRVFHEADHLTGSSDIVGVVRLLLEEEERRRRQGQADYEIPLRPDHGHLLADDIGKKVNPGYSYVGRLKGLAELRGVIRGLKSAIPALDG
jgi:mannonate dehydratase